MKIKRITFFCLLLTLVWACEPRRSASVDIAFRNQTTNEIDFVEVTFGENTCSSGILITNALSVTMDYRYQITPEAKVRWRTANGLVKLKVVVLKDVVPRQESGRVTFLIQEDSVAVAFERK